MATSLDLRFGPLAVEKIDLYGVAAEIHTTAVGDYDPKTMKRQEQSTATLSLKATPPAGAHTMMPPEKVHSEAIAAVLVAGQTLVDAGVVLRNGMRIDLVGKSYTIVEHEGLYSGELVAAWILQLKSRT